jgi:hypothetical protein
MRRVVRWGRLALLSALGACGGAPQETGAPDAGGSLGSDSGGPAFASDGSASATSPDSSSAAAPGADATTDAAVLHTSSEGGASSEGGSLFAQCTLEGGCIADCSAPADDPLGTGNATNDQYDGCLLAGMQVAGMTTWQGQLLKAQAYDESGISPVITTDDVMCGGQNCGIWAISAGSASGDSPPGPCGSSAVDPFTGTVDYSHSYGLFQQTPACEGTFLRATLPSGDTCTGTTEADNIPFGATITFYCESATSLGVAVPTGTAKGYINAVQTASNPLYATSIFNPAYQIYVYMDHTWATNFAQANAQATGCTPVEQWYLSLAYWLTGNATTSCTLTGAGQKYVQTAISTYQTFYGQAWPYPGP